MTNDSWFSGLIQGFSDFADGVSDFFSIDSTISKSSNTKPDDVVKTKTALNALDSYQVPDFGITEIPDMGMIDGIKKFQSNNGLKVDGVMKPGGPTENKLGETLAKKGLSTTDLFEKSKAPTPPTQSSWSNTNPLGQTNKPKFPKPGKINPLTGRPDPLANLPMPKKSKAEMDKLWEQVEDMKKPKTAIVPTGNTVDQRIQSIMKDPRYLQKKEKPIVDHVVKQFEKAYPRETQYDETGKMIQPKAVIQPDEVEPFDPNGELLQNVQMNEDGTVIYTPEFDEPDQGDFEYTVSDGQQDDEKQNNDSEFCKNLAITIKEEEKKVEENGQKYVDADYKVRKMYEQLDAFVEEVKYALSDYFISVGLDAKDIAFGGILGVLTAGAKAGWQLGGLIEKYYRLNLMKERDLPSAEQRRDEFKYLFDKAEKSLAGYRNQKREKCS